MSTLFSILSESIQFLFLVCGTQHWLRMERDNPDGRRGRRMRHFFKQMKQLMLEPLGMSEEDLYEDESEFEAESFDDYDSTDDSSQVQTRKRYIYHYDLSLWWRQLEKKRKKREKKKNLFYLIILSCNLFYVQVYFINCEDFPNNYNNIKIHNKDNHKY